MRIPIDDAISLLRAMYRAVGGGTRGAARVRAEVQGWGSGKLRQRVIDRLDGMSDADWKSWSDPRSLADQHKRDTADAKYLRQLASKATRRTSKRSGLSDQVEELFQDSMNEHLNEGSPVGALPRRQYDPRVGDLLRARLEMDRQRGVDFGELRRLVDNPRTGRKEFRYEAPDARATRDPSPLGGLHRDALVRMTKPTRSSLLERQMEKDILVDQSMGIEADPVSGSISDHVSDRHVLGRLQSLGLSQGRELDHQRALRLAKDGRRERARMIDEESDFAAALEADLKHWGNRQDRKYQAVTGYSERGPVTSPVTPEDLKRFVAEGRMGQEAMDAILNPHKVPYDQVGEKLPTPNAYTHGRNRSARAVNELLRRVRAASGGVDPRGSRSALEATPLVKRKGPDGKMVVSGGDTLVPSEYPRGSGRYSNAVDPDTGDLNDPLVAQAVKELKGLSTLDRKYSSKYDQGWIQSHRAFKSWSSSGRGRKPQFSSLNEYTSDNTFITEYATQVVDLASKVLPAQYVDRMVEQMPLVKEALLNRADYQMKKLAGKKPYAQSTGALTQLTPGEGGKGFDSLATASEAVQRMRKGKWVEGSLLAKAANIYDDVDDPSKATRMREIYRNAADSVAEHGGRYKPFEERDYEGGISGEKAMDQVRDEPGWIARREEATIARAPQVEREKATPWRDEMNFPLRRDGTEEVPKRVQAKELRRLKNLHQARMDVPLKESPSPRWVRGEVKKALPLFEAAFQDSRSGGAVNPRLKDFMRKAAHLTVTKAPHEEGMTNLSRLSDLVELPPRVPEVPVPSVGNGQMRFSDLEVPPGFAQPGFTGAIPPQSSHYGALPEELRRLYLGRARRMPATIPFEVAPGEPARDPLEFLLSL